LVDVITLSVSDLEVEAINISGINSVWARDLYFGVWNFHDLLKSQLIYLFQAITCLNDVALAKHPQSVNGYTFHVIMKIWKKKSKNLLKRKAP
jgi:hypothetical protein